MAPAGLWLALLLSWPALPCVTGARTPAKSVAGKSIYFIVTDRFARSGKDANNYEYCDLATGPDPRVGNEGAFCNGTLQGIIDKLPYIEGMGFDCIWITPVVKSMDYTGYFAENFFEIEPHLGDKATLKRLSAELHARGMCLIIDIVANHVRPVVVQNDYSAEAVKTFIGVDAIYPFNDTSYFHTPGKPPTVPFETFVLGAVPQASQSLGNDAVLADRLRLELTTCGPKQNPNLTQCSCFPGNMGSDCPGFNPALQVEGWFGQLADLNQSVPFVREKLLEYVRYLVREYAVDAFRLDTAIYMDKGFLTDLQQAAGVEIFGETTVNNISYHAGFQKGVLAGLLNFPLFYTLPDSFCQYHLGGMEGDYQLQGAFTPVLPDLQNLADVMEYQTQAGLYQNLDLLMNFADNHDEFARLAFFCDKATYRIRNMLAWVMLARGTPAIYYGTEQGLTGHQKNVLERMALEKAGRRNKGQAYVRESLWQTRYNTSTWQYSFIRQLNELRKKYRLQVGSQKVHMASGHKLVFSRRPEGGASEEEVWIFLNNKQEWSANYPIMYCHAPHEDSWEGVLSGHEDFLSGEAAVFSHGCFVAKDGAPKVLVRTRNPRAFPVASYSSPSSFVILGLLATNGATCLLLWRRRPSAHDSQSSEEEQSLST